MFTYVIRCLCELSNRACVKNFFLILLTGFVSGTCWVGIYVKLRSENSLIMTYLIIFIGTFYREFYYLSEQLVSNLAILFSDELF